MRSPTRPNPRDHRAASRSRPRPQRGATPRRARAAERPDATQPAAASNDGRHPVSGLGRGSPARGLAAPARARSRARRSACGALADSAQARQPADPIDTARASAAPGGVLAAGARAPSAFELADQRRVTDRGRDRLRFDPQARRDAPPPRRATSLCANGSYAKSASAGPRHSASASRNRPLASFAITLRERVAALGSRAPRTGPRRARPLSASSMYPRPLVRARRHLEPYADSRRTPARPWPRSRAGALPTAHRSGDRSRRPPRDATAAPPTQPAALDPRAPTADRRRPLPTPQGFGNHATDGRRPRTLAVRPLLCAKPADCRIFTELQPRLAGR